MSKPDPVTVTFPGGRCPGRTSRWYHLTLRAIKAYGASNVVVVGLDRLPQWMRDDLRKRGVREPEDDPQTVVLG